MTWGSPRAVCGLLVIVWAVLAGGCRAQAYVNGDDMDIDAGVGDLGPPVDLAGVDFTVVPDLMCSATGPEVCGNGCDDDRNGYVDDDDPACTTQLLVTVAGGTPSLGRVILEPTPHLVPLDGNSVPPGAFATYRRAFSSAAFLDVEGAPRQIRRIELPDGGGAGAFSDFFASYAGGTRGLCVFNGELIVVERAASSQLHRLQADGKTELGTVALPANMLATSCATDGNALFVSIHDQSGSASQFVVFDKTYTQVGALVGVPPLLSAAGYQHVLSIAWTKHSGFYGLFTTDLSLNDGTLSAAQIFPFNFDGGSGPPVDAGVLHGLGEFVP